MFVYTFLNKLINNNCLFSVGITKLCQIGSRDFMIWIKLEKIELEIGR